MDGDLLTLLLAARIGCRGHSMRVRARAALFEGESPHDRDSSEAVVRRPISSVTCLPDLAACKTLACRHKSRHRQKAESSAVGHTVIRRSSSRGQ